MKIITKNPIIENGKRISPSDYWHQADGEFIPFEGKDKTVLQSVIDEETGEEYFFSPEDETYYSANGEKVKGFFTKVGKGIWKGLKAIGHAFVVAERWVVKESKQVANGVKKAAQNAKVKHDARKLKRVQAKEQSQEDKKTADYMKSVMASNSDKGKTEDQKTADFMKKTMSDNASSGKSKDIFQLPLTPLTDAQSAKLDAKDVVEANGKKYSAKDIPSGKPITLSTDQNGNKEVVVEHSADEVVAVQRKDGNIDYHLKEDVAGMSKTLKYSLIIGGAVLLIGLGIYLYKKKK